VGEWEGLGGGTAQGPWVPGGAVGGYGAGCPLPQLQCSPVSPVFPAGILQPTLYDPEFPQ